MHNAKCDSISRNGTFGECVYNNFLLRIRQIGQLMKMGKWENVQMGTPQQATNRNSTEN